MTPAPALGSALVLVTLAAPLALVALLAVAGWAPDERRHRLRRALVFLSPAAIVPGVALALLADTGGGTAGASGTSLTIPWLLLGTHFAVDDLGRPLLMIAAVLYGGALSATGWIKMRDAERRGAALCGFLLTAYVGNIGTYLAADSVTFYLSFAVMSFSAAGLVVHYRTPTAHRASRVYLTLSVLSESAILAALLLTVSAGGMLLADVPAAVAESDRTGLVLGLLLFGFGVKAGTVPLHIWLPLAHPAAPPAASAVLSGTMVTAGLIGWLRFVPVPGANGPGALGSGHDAGIVANAGWTLLILALAGAFLAVLFGVLQNDPKVILAYSTISQMGFISAVIAVGMIVPELWPGTSTAAILYAVHHGLAKGALFLGVPVMKHFGSGAASVVAMLGMIGAGLVIAGAPLTSGALGKYVSKDAVEGIALAAVELQYILPLVATGSTLLLMRFGWVLWHSERRPSRAVDGEFASWAVITVAALALPWFIGVAWFDEGALPLPSWILGTVWDATWPILLGIALGAGAWWLTARGLIPRRLAAADGTLVAPGDLLVPEERALQGLSRGAQGGQAAVHAFTGHVAAQWGRMWRAVAARTRRATGRAEARLSAAEVSGAAVLLVLGVAAAFLAIGGLW
ncbi:proton-conducting transporter transmembrane domain-containing protein [Microbacterium album]|uniref:NADH:quinone oxidoreductase/Mrp antiporter transmembrane domain-containing protein n=1 Tax=Microbacterium album TaxID=2053191 RepID=A0A917IH93_9MICO|nr:proton-conducting transporter membrane subunit [Microbacterium album]GGH45725.1 hypothetical protein GCM10010921_21320 [Microbacterium album]